MKRHAFAGLTLAIGIALLNPGPAAAQWREAGARVVPASGVHPPQIAAPAPGTQYRAATPLAIRVTPPTGTTVQTYQIQLEKKSAAGAWEPVGSLPAAAAQAESPAGYTGFGVHMFGTPAHMQATPGVWRVRAQVSAPGPSTWSGWNEFTVVAPDAPPKAR